MREQRLQTSKEKSVRLRLSGPPKHRLKLRQIKNMFEQVYHLGTGAWNRVQAEVNRLCIFLKKKRNQRSNISY